MADIRIQGLSKVFPNGVRAVHNLSLQIAAGELYVLLGPTGCGKTTLLRLMAGLESPDTGSITIGGRDVTHSPPHTRQVAMVFQTAALYPHRSVQENLAFGLGASYNSKGSVQQRVTEAVELLRLHDLLKRRPAELSGGERQRVALGRALIRRPAVFLLDEPLAQLDAPQRRILAEDVKALQQRSQATMLFVTHDQAEAAALADRIGVMRAGSLEQEGTWAELRRQPASQFVAEFLDSSLRINKEKTSEQETSK